MATIQNINVSTPNDGLGDTLRDSQIKANANFAELNSKKVEVQPGLGLSENNFSDADKAKLDGITPGAEANVQADWQQEDTGADDYIKNRPSFEVTDNKQNNLSVYDGTGTKYVGKDGFDTFARNFAKVATKTGLLDKSDTFNLTAFSNSVLRIAPVQFGMFWDELFLPNSSPVTAIKTFSQKDYNLTELVTPTGGNVNANPITTDGKYVRYLAYDKSGNVYSSATNFLNTTSLLQLGFVTVLKTGASVVFLDGTAGPRNVLAQPALASNTEFDKVADTITNITVGRKSDASISTSNGKITGISVNWKSAANPTNSNPIDVFNYTGQTTAAFVAIDPTFLTSTAALVTHTLFTELDGGIPVNESFYNTTTGLRGTMANGSAGVARIMVGVRGGIFWQMGEFATTACYADLATAKSNIYSHVFSEAIVPPGVAYEIARVAYTKGFTVTNNDTQFYLVSTGAGSGGSSVIPPVSDATVATKGVLKLAGDFDATSTADVPVIKKVYSTTFTTTGFITTGGTASQFTMADGSLKSVGAIIKTRKNISGSYTIINSDVDKILYADAGTTITVPSGLTTNQEYEIFQFGAGTSSIITSGTTLRMVDYAIATTYGQYGRVLLSWIDTETYSLFGDLQMI